MLILTEWQSRYKGWEGHFGDEQYTKTVPKGREKD